MPEQKKESHITNLSSERDGRIRLTATGVPRQWAFKISPKDPFMKHKDIHENKLNHWKKRS